MSAEAKPKVSKKAVPPFGPAEARAEILGKLQKAEKKGLGSFFSAKTAPTKRETLEIALSALETDGVIFVDRRKAKPKHYAREFKPPIPDRESVAAKVNQFAALEYPQLLTETELKRCLRAAEEKTLFLAALDFLRKDHQLIELKAKTKVFYVNADSLSAAVSAGKRGDHTTGISSHGEPPREAVPEQDALILEAYRELVQNTHFPDVAISSLHHLSGVSCRHLKEWTLAECRKGSADLSFGDWSLADDSKREGAIEIDGERYLLVRLYR